MNFTVSAPVEPRSRILVIEDEPSVAAFLRTALERRGYEVVGAPSAAEGLQLLASTDFRGVISDFRTPGGINGTDVRDWLLRHRPNLANRIIFITGDTASPETISLLAQAGTPCVEKPFRVHQLMAAVEKAMGKP
ncbi:MAG TPA: response regulator [Candidatus Limnocylindrales bacterium]|nr:response regulator [Candidatus Limnocylindrales bacterium]